MAPATQAFRLHQVAAQSLPQASEAALLAGTGVTAEPFPESFSPELGSQSLCLFAHFSLLQAHQAAICLSSCWRYEAGAPETPG